MQTRIKAIHHPLAVDSGLSSLRVESDYAKHVEQLIKQVLFTSPGERINRPDFGCGIRRLIFAPNSSASANLAQVSIFQALDKWLGDLIRVEEVKVSAEDEQLNIGIAYVLKARQEKRLLSLEVS